MKVLQINSDANSGSAGRIAEDIGSLIISSGNESYIAYGRTRNKSSSKLIKIGGNDDILLHVLKTRLTDRHGFGSERATAKFLVTLDKISPDLIHLHNIHGYYLNIKVLFNYIFKKKLPVVWTLHDCWPFTGHCSYFDAVNCYKWLSECSECPNLRGYPKSCFFDNSKKNFIQKQTLFHKAKNMVLVTPSEWLMGHLRNSFFSDCNMKVIHNGIDLSKFRPIVIGNVKSKYNLTRKYILGVASRWDSRKGLEDFIKLRCYLNPVIDVVLVGLSNKQIRNLPAGIIGIRRTENIDELAEIYSGAEIFINPTYIDNFPLTNLEAMACGTPVIAYRTGGIPESINSATGLVVDKGNLDELIKAVTTIIYKTKMCYSKVCRNHVETHFNKLQKLGEYIDLYGNLLEANEIKKSDKK